MKYIFTWLHHKSSLRDYPRSSQKHPEGRRVVHSVRGSRQKARCRECSFPVPDLVLLSRQQNCSQELMRRAHKSLGNVAQIQASGQTQWMAGPDCSMSWKPTKGCASYQKSRLRWMWHCGAISGLDGYGMYRIGYLQVGWGMKHRRMIINNDKRL